MHYDPSNELIYQENKSKLIYLMARLKKATFDLGCVHKKHSIGEKFASLFRDTFYLTHQYDKSLEEFERSIN